MSTVRSMIAVVSAVTVSSACGSGSDAVVEPTTATLASSAEPTVPREPADVGPTGTVSAAPDDEVPIPVARFVAHGPDDSNTFGPACSTGIDERGGDMFRVTVPPDWNWMGRSGGTGPDQLRFDTSEASVYVDLFRTTDELSSRVDFEVIGQAGMSATLDGAPFAVEAVSIEGRTGFGIVEFPYLGPLPIAGEHTGTVLVTSSDVLLDAQLATDVLSTIRAERCAVVEDVGIWGPGAGVHLVPRFEPDPMGKQYPGGSQPVVSPGVGRINSYTAEQVAYLLPLDEPVASCVAPSIMQLAVDDVVADVTLLSPANAAKEVVAELVEGCS